MRRCGQLNFNERDPLTLDVAAWIDYWASLRVNALLVNGGGIMAFYPTEVPYHHRSGFLGTRDLFGEMAAAARARGIRVVARMDCNYSWEEALRAHPERSEEHTSELQSRLHLVCRLLLEKKKKSTVNQDERLDARAFHQLR